MRELMLGEAKLRAVQGGFRLPGKVIEALLRFCFIALAHALG
jgi:hypothetical protein